MFTEELQNSVTIITFSFPFVLEREKNAMHKEIIFSCPKDKEKKI